MSAESPAKPGGALAKPAEQGIPPRDYLIAEVCRRCHTGALTEEVVAGLQTDTLLLLLGLRARPTKEEWAKATRPCGECHVTIPEGEKGDDWAIE